MVLSVVKAGSWELYASFPAFPIKLRGLEIEHS